MTIKNSSRLIRTLLILFMVGYAIFFSTQLILHYYSFGSRALDLGNMGQVIWNTAQGRLFHQTNQPGLTNRLSLHVEPILLPVSLLYYVYNGPEILFIFQSIVVALGALPVFALACLKLKSEGLALIFALVYLMLPAIQGATLLDFHAVTLAPPFLLATFYYLETRRPKLFALFAILAVSTKEEISLLIMMMGFYAFFINRQRRLGLITVVASLGWALLAVFVIPPTFASTGNLHWGRYSHLGDSPVNIVMNIFLQPDLFLAHLRQVNALDYLRLLLTPTAFVALLNPITLLLGLPSLGINLLSNFPAMQEVNSLIYAAPIAPALIISSIYGVANLKRSLEWLGQRIGEWRMANGEWRVASLRVSESANHTTTTQHTTRNSKDTQPKTQNPKPETLFNLLLGSLILLATLIYHAEYGYLPGGGQFRGWEEVTDHHRRAERIFAQIPTGAALSAQDRLNPHVSQRETLYIFDRVDDADHILLDITLDSWPVHPVELRQQVNEFLRGEFGVVDAFDGYLLLAKDRSDLPKTLPDAFFDFARASASNPDSFSPQFPAAVTFDNKLQLLGYSFRLGAHEQFLPVITLYWRALEPLDQDYTLWPFFIDRNGQLIEDTRERPLVATLWYPTSRWSPDEIIMTSTLPFDLAPNLGDQFTLAVGVAKNDWASLDQRLPISQIDSNLYTFENKTWARLGTFQRTGRKTYHLLPDTITPAQQPRQAQFWNIIDLQGVDLPQTSLEPGDSLPFTLHWQSVAPLTVNLTTFAHLVDEEGHAIAQLDWTPQDSLGYLPTTAWQPERPVIDSQTIPLPPDAPPGQYRLVIGWYYPPSGERLPLTASDIPGENGDVTNAGVVTIQR